MPTPVHSSAESYGSSTVGAIARWLFETGEIASLEVLEAIVSLEREHLGLDKMMVPTCSRSAQVTGGFNA
jgi:hypothetical protein